MKIALPGDWAEALGAEFEKEYFKELIEFVDREYRENEVFPPQGEIFRAFECCKLEDVKVVIFGQDPYHGDNQACGLCFGVPESQSKLPPSLRNILKEVANCGYESIVNSGNLELWAKQGVLLLNSVLTVRAHEAASHSGRGWEKFTDAVVRAINEHRSEVVYMLWGSYAQKKGASIDETKNLVLRGVHPSPLSAYKGWFGCAHFKLANNYLKLHGFNEIEW